MIGCAPKCCRCDKYPTKRMGSRSFRPARHGRSRANDLWGLIRKRQSADVQSAMSKDCHAPARRLGVEHGHYWNQHACVILSDRKIVPRFDTLLDLMAGFVQTSLFGGASSDRDDWAGRVQSLEAVRIACDDVVSALPGHNHDRGVDYVGRMGGAAEFSAGAGELFIERDNRDFVYPQEARQCDLITPIPPSLPHHTRSTRNLRRWAKARSSRAISRLSPRSKAIKAPESSVIPDGAAEACVLPI
jgi:hypothetical protein